MQSEPDLTVICIAAYARGGVIGADGAIPWRNAADFQHFKATTMGHALVMGRATYESIGRPLPGRTTVVVTRNPDWSAHGVVVAHDIATAVDLAAGFSATVFIAGGAEIYGQALEFADQQILSEIDIEVEGDTFYPEFDTTAWHEASRVAHDGFDVVTWQRSDG